MRCLLDTAILHHENLRRYIQEIVEISNKRLAEVEATSSLLIEIQ
jgi:hypothetical protein